MPTTTAFDIKEHTKEKCIAFLDVLGFSNLVSKNNYTNLEEYFVRTTDILEAIREEKKEIQSFLISDSIILIGPTGLNGLKQLVIAIRRIQHSLLFKKILLRGAVTIGDVYYNKTNNIIVGKGYIRAYLLEKEAIYPRVLIDPAIIRKMDTDKAGFLQSMNGGLAYNFEKSLVYNMSAFSKLPDDGIFIDYASKMYKREQVATNSARLLEMIKENMYSEPHIYAKYVWLRDYFKESMQQVIAARKEEDTREARAIVKVVSEHLKKMERL